MTKKLKNNRNEKKKRVEKNNLKNKPKQTQNMIIKQCQIVGTIA